MLAELLQDRAVLYVTGAMTAPEQEGFEVLLEFQPELRAHVAALQEVVATVMMSQVTPVAALPVALKARILGAVDALPPRGMPDALVVTDPGGLVLWVNPAFTEMCGYSLAELQGRKPGRLLQGPDTDPVAVERIRGSLRERRACRETLVNYHKNGTRYRADVRITPILDDTGQPLWFVAREQKLPDLERLAG